MPLKIDSGDLLVMSGFSRKVYHGVPRIIENCFEYQQFDEYAENLKDEGLVRMDENGMFKNNVFHAINFLKKHRINLNFRQVYPSN